MADVDNEQTAEDANEERSGPETETKNGSTSNGRKTAIRMAALAAAGSATALAAKKAFSSSENSSGSAGAATPDGEEESLFAEMLKSGWEAAKGTLLPVAEEAASGAGEYVARSAPDIVRERLVPRFIAGFQRGATSGQEDEEDGEDGEP